MAEQTPRMRISYPSQGQANYFDPYKDGMLSIDDGIFSAWSHLNAITVGGGTLSWDEPTPGVYEFACSAQIDIRVPAFGTAQSIAPDTFVVPPSHFVYADVALGASATGAAAITISTQVDVANSAVVIAWHDPATHALVFATGLTIALGATATGMQPQGGGGGGSISVTDGSTTVNPATTVTVVGGVVADLGSGNAEINIPALSVTDGTITVDPATALIFTAGAVAVNDAGSGNAELQVQLTTNFVVSADGSTFYSVIQSAIDDAHTAYVASGYEQHQVIHIRPGTYTEDLTIKTGIRLVADSEPQTTTPSSAFWGGSYEFNPTACVTVLGNHHFDLGAIRSSFRGIAFSAADSSVNLFYAAETGVQEDNIVQFFDCSFYQEPDNGGVALFTTQILVTDTNFHFEDCKFCYYDGAFGGEMIKVVGNTKFVRCSFDTAGFGGAIRLRADNDGVGIFVFEQCTLTVVDVEVYGGSTCYVFYTDTVHTGPSSECIRAYDSYHEIYLSNSTCIAQDGYAVATTSVSGFLYYDKLSINPLGSAYIGDDAMGSSPVTKITADQVRGETFITALVGTNYVGGTYTAVAWDTSVGGVGARIVELPNAALLQGMYFTVWDSGGLAGSRNINVQSTGSAGGVTLAPVNITNNNGSVLLLATKNALGQACWRAVAYQP